MRLADQSTDDSTRQAISVAERIAMGTESTPLLLPSIAEHAGTEVGSPNSITNGVLMDDDDDDGFLNRDFTPFDIDDAFEEHTNNFKGKVKPKQPSASIAKLPAKKVKNVVVDTPDTYLDDNGNEYEYLGRFDGDTSFLDEEYKGVTVKAGDHLYRRNTGVQFDGELAEYEYFVGDDPESSAIFGKIFKGIGKAVKGIGKGIGKAGKYWLKNAKAVQKRHLKLGGKITGAMVPGAGSAIGGMAQNLSDRIPSGSAVRTAPLNASFEDLSDHLWKKNTNILGDSSNSTISSLLANRGVDQNGDYYEYLGQTNGDLSFLDVKYPGMIVPPGAHIYRVQRTEGFDGVAEYEYFMGAHPEQAEFLGKAFKAIGKAAKAVGKGVGQAAKAVGKGVVKGVKATGKGIGNAAKWTVNKALPTLSGALAASADESNGVTAPYNPTAGFDYGNGGYGEPDFGDGMYQADTRSSIVENNIASEPNNFPQVDQPKNNTLIYVIIAVAVLGAFVYLKKSK